MSPMPPSSVKLMMPATFFLSCVISSSRVIFGKTSVGLPFLGWRITGRKVFLLHKTWKRMQCAIKRIIKDFYTLRISEEEASSRICCVYSCRRICRTHEVSCFLLLQIEPSPDWSGCVARPRKRAGAKA